MLARSKPAVGHSEGAAPVEVGVPEWSSSASSSPLHASTAAATSTTVMTRVLRTARLYGSTAAGSRTPLAGVAQRW